MIRRKNGRVNWAEPSSRSRRRHSVRSSRRTLEPRRRKNRRRIKSRAEITTIEGLAEGDMLHALQKAFINHDAFQCGYCTPGQICSALGLIKEGKVKTSDDIRELMSGNICRCGAYPNIVAAIEEA